MSKPAEKKPGANAAVPLMDNLYAPDVYADEAIGFLLANNTMRITLATAKFDHTQKPGAKRFVVTSRLVMPIAAAENLHKLLGQIIENVKSPHNAKADNDVRTLQ